MAKEIKNEIIWIRVSSQEKEKLKKKAKIYSRSLSNFLLWCGKEKENG